MPGVETWTFNDMAPPTERIVRMGINFGAPGDCNADNGTLWLDYPSNSGKSPDPVIKVIGDSVEYFGKHSLRIKQGDLKWVEAYGAAGIEQIIVQMLPESNQKPEAENHSYTVILHFSEPEPIQTGQRLFDVILQDDVVIKNFDVFEEANGTDIGISKTFTGISISDELCIKLIPSEISPIQKTIICGVEILATT